MSQKAVVLYRLKEGPVCSFEFLRPGSGMTHRLAARIYDLKRDGHTITTRPCRHEWHRAPAVEYVLEMNGRLF